MIISVAIQKGGSGKTTTAINLAAALRDIGHRVLLVDLDPQSNLTQAMGITEPPEEDIYKLLKVSTAGEEVQLKRAIVRQNGMDFIPASLDLAFAELELVSVYGREQLLKEMMKGVDEDYDFILMDCPPAIGMLTVNALVASSYVIMPMQAEFLPLRGLQSFIRFLDQVKKLNAGLEILGILLTRFDSRLSMSENVVGQIKEELGLEDKLFNTRIRINNALARAQEKGVDIFSFDPQSNGALNYMALAFEIQSRLEAYQVSS